MPIHVSELNDPDPLKVIREPDYDLKSALQHARPEETCFDINDIKSVIAQVPGMNDELNWHWVVLLQNGKFAYMVAWCDYTGWD